MICFGFPEVLLCLVRGGGWQSCHMLPYILTPNLTFGGTTLNLRQVDGCPLPTSGFQGPC